MTLYKNKYRIETTRLPEYDYSSAGLYFVTICTEGKIPYMGRISNENMELSKIGEITDNCWNKIPIHFKFVTLDEYIIMPNHVHGIVVIEKRSDCRDVIYYVSTPKPTQSKFPNISPKSGTLSSIIRTFKASVTRISKKSGYPDFKWQARFYEHIIRNERSLNKIREYIKFNPWKWEDDEYFV